jgi:hypothetical protein
MIMSSVDRIRNEYSNPTRGPSGIGSDKKNLAYFSDRASENSKIAPRARGGEVRLPDTGGKPSLPDTNHKHAGNDPYPAAKRDLNSTGDSPYMKGIRRTVNGS